MDAATTQWPQGINGVVKPVEKKPRPQKEQAVHCPRCSSTNTKFCYYNNYSLSQPRYFCKACRRYWTEGGSLRNVPVGGGLRKNKRSSSSSCNINASSSSSSSSKKAIADNATASNFLPQNPNNNKFNGGHDLNLSYNPSQYDGMSEFIVSPSFGVLDAKATNPQNPITASANTTYVPVMELLKSTGNIGSMGLGSFLSAPVSDSDSSMFPSISFPWHDQFNPSLSFSLNGLDQNNGFGNMQGVDQAHCANTSRSNIFPNFEELKPVSNTDDQLEQDSRVQGEDHSNGFNWNGMLAGGSW